MFQVHVHGHAQRTFAHPEERRAVAFPGDLWENSQPTFWKATNKPKEKLVHLKQKKWQKINNYKINLKKVSYDLQTGYVSGQVRMLRNQWAPRICATRDHGRYAWLAELCFDAFIALTKSGNKQVLSRQNDSKQRSEWKPVFPELSPSHQPSVIFLQQKGTANDVINQLISMLSVKTLLYNLQSGWVILVEFRCSGRYRHWSQ